MHLKENKMEMIENRSNWRCTAIFSM